MEDIFWIISQRCNNIRDNLLNKEQSVSVKNRIKAIDEDIAVINKALGRWKEQ